MGAPPPVAARLARPLVVLLFLLSGASGLIFETLWVRLLTTTFGATTFALSTVLTAFMGGLALGGFLAGRYADRLRRPASALLVYGVLELIIASYGLGFPSLLGQLHELHAWIWVAWRPGPHTFALVRFAIVTAVLIVPTTAMGATLPVLSRFYASREGLGRDAGTLYAVNIFGAVSGTFLAGFVLMPAWGLRATNHTACSINLVLGVIAVAVGRWLLSREASPAAAPEPEDAAPKPDGPWGRPVWVALVAVSVSGLVAMVYQQAWTRVLALVVGSSVYAFALILIAFLLGLALGGTVYARRTAQARGQLGNLAVIHAVIGLTVLAGYVFMDQLPAIFVALARSAEITPARVFALKFAVCSMVVLLPTFFMGMIFPATIAVCAAVMPGVGRTVGRVYSVNTVGSILGSFLGGFVLIPALGVQRTIGAMILVNLALATAFTAVADLSRRARLVRAAVVGVVLVATVVGGSRGWHPDRMTAGVFRLALFDPESRRSSCPDPASPVSRLFDDGKGQRHVLRAQQLVGHRPDIETACDQVVGRRLLRLREGVVATVSTWQIVLQGFEPTTCWEVLSLQVNGKSDASASAAFRRPPRGRCRDLLGRPDRIVPTYVSPRSDMETQVLSGLLGQLLHPRATPRRALVIGWGSGVTVGAMAETGLEHIDAVELEPEVLRAARVFERYNHRAASHRAVHLVENDGRNFLIATRRPYDIIVSEPSNPWMTGAASLFTQEFFRLVKRRLAPDGVFIQWLQLYEISKENVRTLIATLRSVFPSVTVFRPRHAKVDLLLVGTRRPLRLDGSLLARRLADSNMKRELARIQIDSVGDLLARHLADDRRAHEATRGAPLNTDDNARVEFSAPRDLINYRKHSHKRILAWLRRGAAPVEQAVANPPADLGLQLADAYLKLGDLGAARRTLSSLPADAPGVAQRRTLLAWLSSAPPLQAQLRTALARHPAAARLDATASGAAEPKLLLGRLRALTDREPDADTFRLLGLLLAGTEHRGLALLFLSAAVHGAALSPGIERVRIWLLGKLSLHHLAWERARRLVTRAATAPR